MEKLCRKCNTVKPLTNEYWHRNKSTKDGFQYWCKICSCQANKQYKKAVMKTPEQRETFNQYQRERYKNPEHKAKVDAANKRWREENPEKYIEINRAGVKKWRENNPDKYQVQVQQQNSRPKTEHDKEIRRKSHRRWQRKHPEANRAKARRYWARKHQAEGSHTHKDVLNLYAEQEGLCAYCGIRLFDDYAVDHYIPLCHGGTDNADNLFCVCKPCNSYKSGYMPQEWVKIRGW